jgi:hypothetical protein
MGAQEGAGQASGATGYLIRTRRGGEKMRKRITLLITALMLALTMSFGGAAAAFADNPHAGNSGHFKGSAKPCDNQNNHPKCPGPK